MYGTSPVALPLVSSKTNTPAADDHIKSLFCAWEEALAAHNLARIKMMERTTRRTKPFKVNDKVWLESKNLKIPYESRKLLPKWEGPFLIKEVLTRTGHIPTHSTETMEDPLLRPTPASDRLQSYPTHVRRPPPLYSYLPSVFYSVLYASTIVLRLLFYLRRVLYTCLHR